MSPYLLLGVSLLEAAVLAFAVLSTQQRTPISLSPATERSLLNAMRNHARIRGNA